MNWQIGHGKKVNCKMPKVMGILNVTPDSFSDGGDFFDPIKAISRAEEMTEQGADLIDIGGESTRPRAEIVPFEEERRRVIPLIEKMMNRIKVPISIDTQKPEIARLAISAGASIINDVSAVSMNANMISLVAEKGCGYVAMHMQGNPQNMQQKPTYEDIINDVDQCFARLLSHYTICGISPEQIVLDVGIGFGKTISHNLALLKDLKRYKRHDRPLLLGASRKSFIGGVLGIGDARDRGSASLACVAWGLGKGVKIFRVHDVLETAHVVKMWKAIEDHNEQNDHHQNENQDN